MVAQRSRDEIDILILQSSQSAVTLTSLMYETYLSHDGIRHYIGQLLEDGLIEYLSGEMKFKITAQGRDYLKSLQRQAEDNACCNHQCKRCGVIYDCGTLARCANQFYHGVCNNCVKIFDSHHTRIPEMQPPR